MDECAVLLQPLIVGKQIELKIDVEVNGLIYADKSRLEQVIVNLVKNSIDFVPEINGKITIVVKKDGDSNSLFFVKDNGEGIKSEDLEKIFTTFYKGVCKQPRTYGGSGLGLVICKGIVEVHGGKYGLILYTPKWLCIKIHYSYVVSYYTVFIIISSSFRNSLSYFS